VRDRPALHELVENVPHDFKIVAAWMGEGSLTLPVCKGKEISELAPVRCSGGLRASVAYVVDDLKIVKNFGAVSQEAAPLIMHSHFWFQSDDAI
jgi:hypothetical protein